MRYTLGQKKQGNALFIAKIWKGETPEAAVEAMDGTLVEPEATYPNKAEARKALRRLLRERAGATRERYDPASDVLVEDVGKLHPGDGHMVKVSVKNQGNGNKILVQRSQMIAGSSTIVGSLGRLEPGAARRLAQLLVKAADVAEQS